MIFNLFYSYSLLCLMIFLSSCSYYVPQRHMIENSEGIQQHCLFNENETALNAASIKIISWNNLAGCRQTIRNLTAFTHCNNTQADQSFLQLTNNRDLILIQEAYMDSDTLQVLKNMGEEYSWDMAVSYIADKKKDIPTGVLTIANARSQSSCPQRDYDAVLATPKAILFTSYNLVYNNTIINEKLLVVNIHAILISKKHLFKQLQIMAEKMSQHNGPIILAGDFNTMTLNSYLKLKEIVGTIGLIETKMAVDSDHRVKSMFGQTYDFIFYKKLKLIDSYSVNLETTTMGKTSDHNPLFAEFKLLHLN